MEKHQFLFLVRNYTSLTAEEAGELNSLQRTYPYSQVIHNLAARAAQDNDLDRREDLLHTSAIYTTDRTLLKSLMTVARSQRIIKSHPNVVLEKEPVLPAAPSTQTPQTRTPKAETNLTGAALRKDILQEIKKLKVSKHKFEVIVEEFERINHPDNKTKKPSHKKKVKSIEPADVLIREIKSAKKKVPPEGKQKEQIEIIENFIKTKPSISKNKVSTTTDNTDLAEKSLLYGDNIVSETLVEILLKQGKKEKAVEVLRKLIWKFPQKKAYFAAQIEKLKT